MSSGRGGHIAVYRLLVALLPAAHRHRYGAEQVQLFEDLLHAGTRPSALWLRTAPDLARTVATTREGRLESLGRLGIAGLSLANLALPCFVATVAVGVAGAPLWVLAICAAVATQGAYTIGWLSGSVARRPLGTWLFAAGESAAAVLGLSALGVMAVAHAHTGFSDPEYGPLTIVFFVTLHALVGVLLVLADRRNASRAT